jgi:hypothetical protein
MHLRKLLGMASTRQRSGRPEAIREASVSAVITLASQHGHVLHFLYPAIRYRRKTYATLESWVFRMVDFKTMQSFRNSMQSASFKMG